MDLNGLLTTTRRSLHGVAELLLAGPQHEASGTIRLRAFPGGFATTQAPDIRVDGTALVAGDRRAGIDGRTVRQLADELGIVATALSHVYRDGADIGLDDVLHVDAAAADRIARAYDTGDRALRTLTDQTPILWPEHLDVGIALDAERVNLGVSPGDSALGVPYMYVGPWEPRAADDFWNQSFGAARELADDVDEVVSFFEEGRSRLSR